MIKQARVTPWDVSDIDRVTPWNPPDRVTPWNPPDRVTPFDLDSHPKDSDIMSINETLKIINKLHEGKNNKDKGGKIPPNSRVVNPDNLSGDDSVDNVDEKQPGIPDAIDNETVTTYTPSVVVNITKPVGVSRLGASLLGGIGTGALSAGLAALISKRHWQRNALIAGLGGLVAGGAAGYYLPEISNSFSGIILSSNDKKFPPYNKSKFPLSSNRMSREGFR